MEPLLRSHSDKRPPPLEKKNDWHCKSKHKMYLFLPLSMAHSSWKSTFLVQKRWRELAWCSGCVMGLPRDSQGFDSQWEWCKNRASRPSQGTVNGGAISNWPRCQWDLNTTNQPSKGVASQKRFHFTCIGVLPCPGPGTTWPQVRGRHGTERW